eukprot:384355_1
MTNYLGRSFFFFFISKYKHSMAQIQEGWYDEEQQKLLWLLTLICGITSIVGQFLIFCTFICLKLESPISARVEKDKARSIHVFIACISFYDFFRVSGILINSDYPYSDNKDECITESVLVAFGGIAIYVLIGLIAIIMVVSVLLQSKAEYIVGQIHKLRAFILCLITVLALLGALIPINYWCSADYHSVLRGVYFVPLLIVYGIVITSYTAISIYFCSNKSMQVSNNFYRDIKLYPAILVLCWILQIYRRIYNVINDKEPAFVIACIAVIGVSIYGFCNFLAYYFTMSCQYKKKKDMSTLPSNENEMQAIRQHDDSD